MAAIDIVNHHSPPSSPDHTNQTYDVSFFDDTIETTVTHDPETVTNWIDRIDGINHEVNRVIIGLDVESRPSISHSRNPIATVQICFQNECLIYQIIHADYIPDAIKNFFFVNRYNFGGVGVKSDLEKLDFDYGIGRFARGVELGTQAAEAYDSSELKNAGLEKLAKFVLGRKVKKERRVSMSDWDERRLTAEQIKYACVDAYVSSEIGSRQVTGTSIDGICQETEGGRDGRDVRCSHQGTI